MRRGRRPAACQQAGVRVNNPLGLALSSPMCTSAARDPAGSISCSARPSFRRPPLVVTLDQPFRRHGLEHSLHRVVMHQRDLSRSAVIQRISDSVSPSCEIDHRCTEPTIERRIKRKAPSRPLGCKMAMLSLFSAPSDVKRWPERALHPAMRANPVLAPVSVKHSNAQLPQSPRASSQSRTVPSGWCERVLLSCASIGPIGRQKYLSTAGSRAGISRTILVVCKKCFQCRLSSMEFPPQDPQPIESEKGIPLLNAPRRKTVRLVHDNTTGGDRVRQSQRPSRHLHECNPTECPAPICD